MTRDQVANRAIANLAVALDLDPGALKLIHEEIELAYDEGKRPAEDVLREGREGGAIRRDDPDWWEKVDDVLGAMDEHDGIIDRNLTARTERTRGE